MPARPLLSDDRDSPSGLEIEVLGGCERRGWPEARGERLRALGVAESWRLSGFGRRLPHVQIGVIDGFVQSVSVG